MCGEGGGGDGPGGQGATGQGQDPEGNFGMGMSFGGSDGGGGGGYDYGRGYNPGGSSSPGDEGNTASATGTLGAPPGDVGGVGFDLNTINMGHPPVDTSSIGFSTQEEAAQAASLVNDAKTAAANSSNQLETFIDIVLQGLQAIGSMVIGSGLVGLISDGLNAFGVNSESVAGVIEGMNSGLSGADIAGSLGPGDMGGPEQALSPVSSPTGSFDSATSGSTTGGGSVTGNPSNYSFWDKFVDEWMTAKGKIAQDDAFRKSKVEPAIGKYQDILSNLSNEAKTGTGAYTPIKFGMGDFKTSFVPKSGLRVADDRNKFGNQALMNELALTDVMQPNKGELDYLQKLKGLAQWQYEKQQEATLAREGHSVQRDIGTYEPDDKGTWLDAIKDVVQIGDTFADAWKKFA